MMLEEAEGKRLLARAGLPVPAGRVATSSEEAARAAADLGGYVVVKAQVPAGGRGKAGGVALVDHPAEAQREAARLLGSTLGSDRVERVLVEERVAIAQELYAAVLSDPASRSPLVMCSAAGGIEVEDLEPRRIARRSFDIRKGLAAAVAREVVAEAGIPEASREEVGRVLGQMWGLFCQMDADLVEINPLAVDTAGKLWALDCKLSLDEAALARHPGMERRPAGRTALERRAADLGMLFMEFDGSVGILANGAGLTMATLDVVVHFGGRPANFLEIGGQNYSRARDALALVLDHQRVRSVLVNFCGAFARTDVMTEGVVQALEELRPKVPFFFSIHGTGEEDAVTLVRARLGSEPYDLMEDAVRAAVQAAR